MAIKDTKPPKKEDDLQSEALIKSLDSSQSYHLLESLYARNQESPVFHMKAASRVYGELFKKVEEIVLQGFGKNQGKGVRDLPFSSLFSIAEMIVYVVPHSPDVLLQVMRPDYLDHFFPCHLLNVAVLSFEVGRHMKMKNHELAELTAAALLHDIGMTRIDPALFAHNRVFGEKEKERVEQHPREGHQFLLNVQDSFPWILRVILEEHKREDNSGYPKDVKGELHPYSKIVGLCDSFEALTHRRHFRKAYHPADAMKILIRKKGKEYAPSLIKSLIDAVSLYPIGSFVFLNNDKVAKVVRPIEKTPLSPEVQLVEENASGKLINLSQETTLYIAGIVYDENYQPFEKPE